MKLEVGMYVRTEQGIAKYLGIGIEERFCEEYDVHLFDECIFNAWNTIDIEEIDNYTFKASHNIIDLIEEKDLLEIEYYSLRYEERVTRLFEVSFKEGKYTNLCNKKCEFMLINGEFNERDKELEPIIKSIVTKEQFESMAYKVGDE